jgi:hypothetical protein
VQTVRTLGARYSLAAGAGGGAEGKGMARGRRRHLRDSVAIIGKKGEVFAVV